MRDIFLSMLEAVLARTLSVETLWREFTFSYTDTSEDQFSDYDALFFSEVNDKLHYTAWTTPSVEDRRDGLIGPDDFREWLQKALTEYKAGSFVDDWTRDRSQGRSN